ncbi:hypothetical protein FXW78_22405 [Rhodococcus opacus]|nr:hypothetical protein [Rhodococcus opacus]
MEGDWINQRNTAFDAFTPIGDKVGKGQKKPLTVFDAYSRGLATARDAWVYNYSPVNVESNVRRMIDFYNNQVDDFDAHCHTEGITDRKSHIDNFIDLDATKISWGGNLKMDIAAGKRHTVEGSSLGTAMYRPFTKQYVHFDRSLNERVYQLPKIFPPRHIPTSASI